MENTKIMTISGVQCYEFDGVAYLHLETVARRLGFTQEKNGVEYVRWETVMGWMERFGFPIELGKTDYIPENIFYRLAMKAKNETAEQFQALVADEIIPAIRRTGSYSVKGEAISPADYMKAAQIVSKCPNKRLPIVLSLLEAGGIRVEVPVKAEQVVTLMEPAKPERYPHRRVYTTEQRTALADEAVELLWSCGLNNKQMAEKLGLPYNMIAKYRNGYRRPEPERAKHIVKILKAAMESVEVGA